MKTLIRKCLVSLGLVSGLLGVAYASAAPEADLQGKNVVLVHGAFADGSSWSKVIPILESKGLHVVAVQNPLTSLKDDAGATRRVIEQQTGPVILVGHSWAGAVITEAGDEDKVKALVYVAALAPDQGQSLNDMIKPYPAPAWTAELRKDSAGFLTLSDKAIAQDFATDVSPAEAKLLAATQGPWFAGCLDDKVTHAAWHDKASWMVVTDQDRMIDPRLQAAVGKQIGATIIKVDSSHVAMLSKPEQVAAAIIAAARSVK
ncbi:alpha/beta fold hydrolase [Paraburkholderia sp. BL25I1N1]|uniref:alpha/beta fold hydrolase n=1 Tax=Paraburkholderia sp. BL25I1N1 TaxID=1938804 RepID=UPI000D0766AE|nr:alpha/beta hydrolase [Paraburkholderia sp. BL25I1N1]PRY04446.1 pimeloyl-ACP methyl ester carboxylesterase [Paraburkholderia sp. BL25I1N1]